MDERGYDFEAFDWPWTKTDIPIFTTFRAESTQTHFKCGLLTKTTMGTARCFK